MNIMMKSRNASELTAGSTCKMVKKSVLSFFRPEVNRMRKLRNTVHMTRNWRVFQFLLSIPRLSKKMGKSTRKKSKTYHCTSKYSLRIAIILIMTSMHIRRKQASLTEKITSAKAAEFL